MIRLSTAPFPALLSAFVTVLLSGLVSVIAVVGASSAFAGDDFARSIDTCRDAITSQIKAEPGAVRITLGKIKSQARALDMTFRISSVDAAGPLRGVPARCTTTLTGEVKALSVDGKAFPTVAAAAN